MQEAYTAELSAGLDAVRIAVQVCRSVQGAISEDVLEKQDRSPVTVADYASQAVICRALAAAFPDDPVIAEEDAAELRQSGSQGFRDRVRRELAQVGIAGSDEDICAWIDHGGAGEFSVRFWTLDPIDGTKGFLRGGQYAISLALIVEGQIVVAVLGCPNLATADGTGCIFTAVRGGGAWQRSLQTGDASASQIAVSEVASGANARLCESVESGHSAHDQSAQIAQALGVVNSPVRMDSQAKYAAVARGDAEIYLRLPTRPNYREKIWDHAGGALIAEEAGGKVTDVAGRPLDFTHGCELSENRGVVVTNRRLHEAVVEAVGQFTADSFQ